MFRGTLRPFQREAARFMLARGAALLALPMGLGKTPTVLAVTEDLFEVGEANTALVVTKASLAYQFRSSVYEFTDSDALVIDGTPEQRKKKYFQARTDKPRYIIVNYNQVVDDFREIMTLPRDVMIVDEITMIKNFRAKRSKRLKTLSAPFRFALTGQPVEDRPEDVYSIMQWIDARLFGPFELFEKAFIERNEWGRVTGCKRPKLLNKVLRRVMYRRTDEEVSSQLPKVRSKLVKIHMDPSTYRLHDYVADQILKVLEEITQYFGRKFDLSMIYSDVPIEDPAMQRLKGKLMSRMSCLLMLADHPELVRISAADYMRSKSDEKDYGGSAYAAELIEDERVPKTLPTPKLSVLKDILEDRFEADPGAKVVIFSQFKRMVKLLQEELPYSSVLFHGSMSSKAREEARQKFLNDPATRLFISTDAGGYGVDLPKAQHLVQYDASWSSGAMEQRAARITRLTSDFPWVHVTNLAVEDSIEIYQRQVLAAKYKLGSVMIDGDFEKDEDVDVSTQSLKSFLEDRGYGLR